MRLCACVPGRQWAGMTTLALRVWGRSNDEER